MSPPPSRPKTVDYTSVEAEARCSPWATQTFVHLPLFCYLPQPPCSVFCFCFFPWLALCSTLLSRLQHSFHSVLFLPPFPSPPAWNPLPPSLPLPQLKTTLCNRGSGQPSLSQQSQLVSAKPRVSLESSRWHPYSSFELLDFFNEFTCVCVCFHQVALWGSVKL